jgi:uncharacterized protein
MIKLSCPICAKRLQGESLKELPYFPFCCKRCKQIDLGRWLDGTYQPASDEDDDPTPQDKDIP